MPQETGALDADSLIDLETARDYIQPDAPGDFDARILDCVNEALGVMRGRCRRNFRSRVYDGGGSNLPAFILNGTGTRSIYVPEYPVTAVSAASYRDDTGTYTLLDIAGARWDDAGLIYLPNNVFPLGIANIQVKATCGYPSALATSQFLPELRMLELAQKRIAQCLFYDWKDQLARGKDVTVQGLTVNYYTDALPKDIEAMLMPFRRVV